MIVWLADHEESEATGLFTTLEAALEWVKAHSLETYTFYIVEMKVDDPGWVGRRAPAYELVRSTSPEDRLWSRQST